MTLNNQEAVLVSMNFWLTINVKRIDAVLFIFESSSDQGYSEFLGLKIFYRNIMWSQGPS